MTPRSTKITVDIQSIETGKKSPRRCGGVVLSIPGGKSLKSRKGRKR